LTIRAFLKNFVKQVGLFLNMLDDITIMTQGIKTLQDVLL